ncbi:MAG: PilZ domain-containing protein [Acidobacteria bacterium]|nr:PilZ domain-containing protein [Acidobacteriota bacterium]
MFVQHAMNTPILRECPDRRRGERFVHRESVQVNGRPVIGCDISARGVSVLMRPPVVVGAIVRVTLGGDTGPVWPGTTSARVARVDPRADRCIVGLEFIR